MLPILKMITSSPNRKTRRYWTEEESDVLRRSVAKYGGHKWALIMKNEPIFQRNGRNQVDLKDRWRNMTRQKSPDRRSPARRGLTLPRSALPLVAQRSPARRLAVGTTMSRRSRSPVRTVARAVRSPRRARSLSPVSDIVIYTIANCGYCKDIKTYLDKAGIRYRDVKVTNANKDEIYRQTDRLSKKYRYFPMVFINGRFIGGYTEFKKLYNIK